MKLDTYLESLEALPSHLAVVEIGKIVPRARPGVSFFGKRTFEVDQYEGTGSLNKLGNLYLKSATFAEGGHLEARLKHDALQISFQQLYTSSDAVIRGTWVARLCNFFLEMRFLCKCCTSVVAVRISSGNIPTAFAFTPEEFTRLWPTDEPKARSGYYPPHYAFGTVEMLHADGAMVKKACTTLEETA